MSEGELGETGNTAIYPSLRGKRVIVTGGGSGIGAAMVEAFARQGSRVAFVDIQDGPSNELCEQLSSADIPPQYRNCDVTDMARLAEVMSELVDELEGCDILVNNAARDDRHPVGDVSPDYWDKAMATNLKHAFFTSQAVLSAMKAAGGGSVINLGSISWHLGLKDLSVYQIAKAALEGMTRSLAREWGEHNIRVNAILPGNVQTPRQQQWYTPEGEAEIVAAQCLKGRIQPEDVAALALFLASDDARFCTAHNYWIDAGWR